VCGTNFMKMHQAAKPQQATTAMQPTMGLAVPSAARLMSAVVTELIVNSRPTPSAAAAPASNSR
jgi:hypothetical protein